MKSPVRVLSFDFDSTLSDSTHRQFMIDRKADNGPEFWNRYSMACIGDTPGPAYPLAKHLSDTGQQWIIVSGRSEAARDISMEWLSRYGLKPLYVFLCDDRHNYMDHGLWKGTILKEVQEKYNLDILVHFDDFDPVAIHSAEIGVPTVLVHSVGQGAMALG